MYLCKQNDAHKRPENIIQASLSKCTLPHPFFAVVANVSVVDYVL